MKDTHKKVKGGKVFQGGKWFDLYTDDKDRGIDEDDLVPVGTPGPVEEADDYMLERLQKGKR
jgi:hypothetical protein